MTEIKKLGQVPTETIGPSASILTGLLRRGQILGISAPRRSLKTSVVISLALSLAQGSNWLEWKTKRAFNVLYINTNHKENDCFCKFMQIARLLEVGENDLDNISVLTLSKSTTLEDLVKVVKDKVTTDTFQVVIIDSIDNLKLPQFGGSLGDYLQQINQHVGGGLIYTQSHRDRPKGITESLDFAQWSESLAYCDSLLEFFKMELDPELLLLERLEAVWDLAKNVMTTHNKRYFQLNVTNDYISLKNKRATSEDLRNHIEVALEHLPAEKTQEILQLFDSKDLPLKTRTYWRLEAITSEADYDGENNFLFYYPRLVNDKEKILAYHEPGIPLSKGLKEKVWAYEETKEKATNKLKSMIADFEHANNRLPNKSELSRFAKIARPTLDKLIQQTDNNIVVVNGMIQENPAY